ncbi:uncharacterized protein LOC143140857 [Alosa pseudoharengus]|uniref:uncharacterized protein LOC143140857 n=1 Tax=Alosa pseudoharengus TaxID=34774 RepID=UPI003F8C2B23
MSVLRVAVFGTLICTVVSATIKAKEEHRTAFFGEDVHIRVPSLASTDVVFKPRVKGQPEKVLMQNGNVVHTRATLNTQFLILEDVGEEDEGVYMIKNTEAPTHVRHITLIVRDCALEQTVKYGDTYHIQLHDITLPITLEFRYGIAHINQTTESPPVVLLNQTSTPVDEYKGRLAVSAKWVTLHRVTGMDEGSYTILDSDGKIRMRTCLNVKEHQNFIHLEYDKTLKINLHLNYDKVNMVYTRDSDRKERVILNQGKLMLPVDPVLDGRLSVEGSVVYLKQVRASDMGTFRVKDLLGFHVAEVHLEVESYKLPPLTVAILAMLGLVVVLLLVCLLSCQINVRRRAEKARKIALIAQQAGKGEGDTFRQVVHEAYTRFTEDSITQSQWDQNTDNTEVEIKGLEVSKAGRYQSLLSDKNFLEMSDSGVEFTSSGLPLDSDTDVPMTYGSNKPLLDSVHSDGFVTAQPTIAEGTESNSRTPDSILSGSPASLPKANGQPDGNLMETIIPDSAPRGPEVDGVVIPAPAGSPAKEPSTDVGPAGEAASTPSGAVENATT